VLYRSNAQSRVIETALFNAAVPYRVYGGLRFFERAEIKHALAYLRLLENPQRRHQLPARGQLSAARHWRAQHRAAAGRRARRRLLAARRGERRATARPGANLGGFVAKLDVLREQTQGMTLRDIIELVLEHSGLVEHYRPTAKAPTAWRTWKNWSTPPRALSCRKALAATRGPAGGRAGPAADPVARSARGWTRKRRCCARMQARAPASTPTPAKPCRPLAAFLTHAALEAGDNQAQAGQDAVQLMTVHASQGAGV
jgi:DNA helicase-2/ATP-dependent DNA helicase PcrA